MRTYVSGLGFRVLRDSYFPQTSGSAPGLQFGVMWDEITTPLNELESQHAITCCFRTNHWGDKDMITTVRFVGY